MKITASNSTDVDIVSQQIKDLNNTIQGYEDKILNFVNFIKKTLMEKEKATNLSKACLNKLNEHNEDPKEEKNENKSFFEKKFDEIKQLPQLLNDENFLNNYDENSKNKDTPGASLKQGETHDNAKMKNYSDHLNELLKGAKTEMSKLGSNKNIRSSLLDEMKKANEQIKSIEIKIKAYYDVLKISISSLGIDKNKLLLIEVDTTKKKIVEEMNIMKMRFLENIHIQSNFEKEKDKRNKNYQSSLQGLLNNSIMFLEDIGKKILDLKGNTNNNLKFRLEKLNSETQEYKIKLEEFDFFNYQKSDELLNSFNSTISICKQNNYLMGKILSLSESLYVNKLDQVFNSKINNKPKRNKNMRENEDKI